MIKITLIISAAVLTASCAVSNGGGQPELLVPASVRADTARVTRGNVERIEQYKGTIRSKSEMLYFEETGLRFMEYHCLTGDSVAEGQVLATLDTEHVEKQIEAQRDYIERLKTEYGFENESMELDVQTARVELSKLIKRAQSYDVETMNEVETAKLSIERRLQTLSHSLERQELTLKYAEADLERLLDEIKGAELKAPFDGVVKYMVEKYPGDWVEPYTGVIWLSDESERFVEYTAQLSVYISRQSLVFGVIGEQLYPLERIPLTPFEISYYSVLRQNPPIRFRFVDAGGELPLGSYVSIYIYSEKTENVLRIPVNTLYSNSEIGPYVYVIENGQKALRQVETGARSPTFVEIKSGLLEGDEVFVKL